MDDEPIARRVLREELELFSRVQVIGEAEDGRQALHQIAKLAPDLVFLDLQMPGMGGFEVVRNLKSSRLPIIVIVTAFDQHAIEAFEAGAVDYLLKPVNERRLRKAVERATALQGQPHRMAELLANIASPPPDDSKRNSLGRKIVARSGEEYFLLDADEVLAIRAEGGLVWIITARHRLLAAHSMQALEARLGGSFFLRVHRNAIVNVNHVRKMSALSSQRWLLTLSNQQQLTVSKRQAASVRNMLQW